MTVRQKRWLVGKLETQALYGESVLLLAESGTWSKIAVPDQTTPASSSGYLGWVRSVQLTATPPSVAAGVAVIRQPTAGLWQTSGFQGPPAIVMSYATTLPALSWTSSSVEVVLLDGRELFLRRRAVRVHADETAWPTPTGAALVAEARRFRGLSYLWAGTSGFGFDCSGFTYTLYRAFGIQLPRDAAAQFARGRKVGARAALRPGDLVFFRDAAGRIHHVGIYIGKGDMIHSPATGRTVTITALSVQPYAREFAGGRRYLR